MAHALWQHQVYSTTSPLCQCGAAHAHSVGHVLQTEINPVHAGSDNKGRATDTSRPAADMNPVSFHPRNELEGGPTNVVSLVIQLERVSKTWDIQYRI